jgi:hypothetical protein
MASRGMERSPDGLMRMGHSYVAVHGRMLRLLYTDLVVVFLFLRSNLDGWTDCGKVKQSFDEMETLGSRTEWDMWLRSNK